MKETFKGILLISSHA